MPAEQEDYARAVIAEMGERISVLEAELLAAQERHEEFKRVAMKESELAQEREKALRVAASELLRVMAAQTSTSTEWSNARQRLSIALAGSPSEKPGSEETEIIDDVYERRSGALQWVDKDSDAD